MQNYQCRGKSYIKSYIKSNITKLSADYVIVAFICMQLTNHRT